MHIIRRGHLCTIGMVIIMAIRITGTINIVTIVTMAITMLTEDRCIIGELKAKSVKLKA
jgi:hypothetical protein